MIREKLITLLQDNARLTLKSLSSLLGITEKKVETEIVSLEQDGSILKYTAVLNPKLRYGAGHVQALVELEVRPEKNAGYDAIAAKLSKFDHVVDLYLISGRYDFLVILEGEDLQNISQFVSKIAAWEAIKSTHTHFILNKYKEMGVSLTPQSDPKRLAVSL